MEDWHKEWEDIMKQSFDPVEWKPVDLSKYWKPLNDWKPLEFPMAPEESETIKKLKPMMFEVARDVDFNAELSLKQTIWHKTLGYYRMPGINKVYFECGMPYDILLDGEWRAVWYHEFGHLVNGHSKPDPFDHEANYKHEFVADAFAAERGYGAEMRSALLKLAQVYPEVRIDSWSHPSDKRRIERLDQLLQRAA